MSSAPSLAQVWRSARVSDDKKEAYRQALSSTYRMHAHNLIQLASMHLQSTGQPAQSEQY